MPPSHHAPRPDLPPRDDRRSHRTRRTGIALLALALAAMLLTACGLFGPATPAPADKIAIDLSPVLEQIRTLGELKDAGYITDEEFERIKRRLLDGSL